MWWLGCTGIWLKSEGGANVCVDFGAVLANKATVTR